MNTLFPDLPTPIVDGVHQITVAEVKAIVAEENGKIENEIRHGNG